MQAQTVLTPKELLTEEIKRQGLAITAVFVPFSQSRNKAEKLPSLNWRVALTKNGREVLTTDYGGGSAGAPGYKNADKPMRARIIAWECENGYAGTWWSNSVGRRMGAKPIQPDSVEVIWSLTRDADVLNYSTYEQWAGDLGYDPDSRKGEAIYRACLGIALKLRNALGEDGLAKLVEAGQDY